ncbi:MAG: SpoIID/LytB domain-containing protein [Christensenellaceae bacterium]|nr:SpoIID/LytB domain-containing protein [Christensenellaceae bacterium]
MKKALALVLTITMLFAFCTGMAEGWTAIEPNTGGESTQAEGGTGGDYVNGNEEPEYIPCSSFEDPDDSYESEIPEDMRHIYLDESRLPGGIAPYAVRGVDTYDVRKVRVLISQRNHSESTVRIYGNYAVHDAAGNALFIAEDEAAYTVKAENSAVSLYSAFGTLLYSGASVSFKEFESGHANNCVKVDSVSMGNKDTDRTYRGDLNIYYFDKTGSYSKRWAGLYLVNNVYMEDYIQGVVAAEMGKENKQNQAKGWPAEAQKAQAVAARTFAMNKTRSSLVFDVYDTSKSQAYFGITDWCKAAVQATAGQILYYDNKVLRVHYTGTNGGDTEVTANYWGEGETGCGKESVREDIYDLMVSGKDYVEYAEIPVNYNASNKYVKSLVDNVLIPNLTASGYAVSSAAYQSLSISVPKCLDMSCTHHNRKNMPADQVCNHFCSVDIAFYGVTINGTQQIGTVSTNVGEKDFYVDRPLEFFVTGKLKYYWLKENVTNGVVTSYTIRHARNASGTGLSQYGAKYRALEGHKYDAILDFYFPQSSIAPLASDISRPAIQAKPSVRYDARVLGGPARVFSQKSAASDAIATIQADNTVFVNEISGKWAHVSCGSISGYIAASTLERTPVRVTTANISKNISVWPEPDSMTTALCTVEKGTVLELIEADAAPGWHKVNTASGAGYIPVRYSTLIFQGSGEQFDEPTGLEDSLSYYGAAIKLSGDYGIRVRFGIDIAAHDGGTIAGYTIKEHGVIADGEKQRAYYTENGAKYDKVSAVADGMALFAANIDNIAALKAEHSFVPYIIAENAKGEITHYGDEVKLSVYSVAEKLKGEYAQDSAEGQYIAALIAQANAE